MTGRAGLPRAFALTTSEVSNPLLSNINFDSRPLLNAEPSGKPLTFSEPQSNGKMRKAPGSTDYHQSGAQQLQFVQLIDSDGLLSFTTCL